jgi:hypothetical protein
MLIIQDRWGNVVFETNQYDPDSDCTACSDGAWNGTKNRNSNIGDNMLSPGAYSWYCEFEDWSGIKYTREGTVTLIR